jgi:hypothetical protein
VEVALKCVIQQLLEVVAIFRVDQLGLEGGNALVCPHPDCTLLVLELAGPGLEAALPHPADVFEREHLVGLGRHRKELGHHFALQADHAFCQLLTHGLDVVLQFSLLSQHSSE